MKPILVNFWKVLKIAKVSITYGVLLQPHKLKVILKAQGEHYLCHFGSALQLLITATATTTLSIEDAKTTEDFLDLECTLGNP